MISAYLSPESRTHLINVLPDDWQFREAQQRQQVAKPIDLGIRKRPLQWSEAEIEAVLTGGASSAPAITIHPNLPTIKFVS